MAYNPNPPFTPSDYGISGELDKDKLQEQLQSTRDYIAALGNVTASSNTSDDIKNAIAALGNDTAPVYGEGVPEPKSYLGDKSTYNLYQGYTSPPGMEERHAEDRAYKQMILESLNQPANPEVEKEDKVKDKDKDKGKDKNKGKDGLKLPGLGDQETYSFGLYNEGSSAPDFEKNPTFDGKDFDYFLKRAKATKTGYSKAGEYDTGLPDDPEKNKLYNALKDAGLSEEEMFKGAQYAGITNLRTENKSIKKDVEDILKAVESNYYADAGKSLKSEKDLFKEFKKLGGKGNLQEFKDAQKYESYDSKKDAKQFANYLSDQLVDQGIYKSSGIDKAQNKFGKKFSMSEYNAALGYKNQDAEYISDYLKDYMERGGRVGSKVQALISPNQTASVQTSQVMGPVQYPNLFQSTFPTDAVEMGPVQYPNLFFSNN